MVLKPGSRLPHIRVDTLDVSEAMYEDVREKMDTLRTRTPPKPTLYRLEGGNEE